MVGKRNMKNEHLFAETNIFDGKIKILFSLFTLENLMDKTINEVSEMLKNEPQDEETSIILSRYNREGSDAKELLELPLLSRIMVHELGHVHQLSMLENESSEYKLNRINISLVARMVKKNEFPSIPMKLKELIKEKILEKVLGVFEYSAEAYFIDAVPCVI